MKYDNKFLKDLKTAQETKEDAIEVCDEQRCELIKELEKLDNKEKQIKTKYDNQRVKKVMNYLKHYQYLKKVSCLVLDTLFDISADLCNRGITATKHDFKKYNFEKLSKEIDSKINYGEFRKVLDKYEQQSDIKEWDCFCESIGMKKYSTESLSKINIYYSFLQGYCELLLTQACIQFGHDYEIIDETEEPLQFPNDFNPLSDVPEKQTVYKCKCKNCGEHNIFVNKVVKCFELNQENIDRYSSEIQRLSKEDSYIENKRYLLTPIKSAERI
jgi:hypothetical protein